MPSLRCVVGGVWRAACESFVRGAASACCTPRAHRANGLAAGGWAVNLSPISYMLESIICDVHDPRMSEKYLLIRCPQVIRERWLYRASPRHPDGHIVGGPSVNVDMCPELGRCSRLETNTPQMHRCRQLYSQLIMVVPCDIATRLPALSWSHLRHGRLARHMLPSSLQLFAPLLPV
jgi:hypothetical protein